MTYETMTPEEQQKYRESVLLSAAKDAWYLLSHADSYVAAGTFTIEQLYANAESKLKIALDWHNEHSV